MSYILRYIIKEKKTSTTLYTLENKEDNTLKDVDENTVKSLIDEIENLTLRDTAHGPVLRIPNGVKRIEVNNMSNTGGKLVQGLNDLETYCRKNGMEEWLDFYNNADNKIPAKMISRSSNKIVKVKCTHCDYSRDIMLVTFTNQNNHACPVCQTKYHSRCMPGINDLYTYCKENELEYLIDEFEDESVDIHNIGYSSHTKIHWKCKYGHEWDATPSHRTNGENCPYCVGAQTSKTERAICNWLKENNINIIERGRIDGEEFDIEIVDYNILIELNSDATHVTEKAMAKDKKKIEIAKRLNKRFIVLMQNCYSTFDETLHYDIKFKTDKRNYLDELLSELSKIFAEQGLIIETTISKNAVALANKNEVPFERSLLGVYPDIEQYWSDENEVGPEVIYAKSRRHIYLKCLKHNCTNSIRADSLAYTYNTNRGCPYCGGDKPVKGVNDLLTLEPELCRDWCDTELRPDEVLVHSNKKVHWKCQFCGYEWDTMINNRTGVNRTGCPNCSQELIKDEDVLDDYDF